MQVMKKFDYKVINLIKETLYFKPKDFAQFAHLIFHHNLNGDSQARKILNDQIPIIEKSIISAGFNEDHPFCLLGGLGKFYNQLIGEEFLSALVKPKGDAVN